MNNHTFDIEKLEQAPTRDGFGRGLVEAGEADPKVVALCADLAESTRTHWFKEKFPERYVELGVAEQNLATVASGMANYGKIPFIMSYAAFSPGRNNEQIRTTISLNNVPVKVVGCHAGVSVGPDGATHQALEDIALMRVQPNMKVIVPADSEEARRRLSLRRNILILFIFVLGETNLRSSPRKKLLLKLEKHKFCINQKIHKLLLWRVELWFTTYFSRHMI
ncbi:MAG: hypothetical protein R3B65_03100 [Candidatus Paceibacterota bacterium]